MTPKNTHSRANAETIYFSLGECSLGCVLLASSAVGVCALFLGDKEKQLLQELQACFPDAKLVAGDSGCEQPLARVVALLARVVALIEAPAADWNIPLDMRGTAFQTQVWQALQTIAPGRTLSYRELAVQIGSPNAIRAVASACAANKIALAIPCHRVVRSDGTLSGYRWGVERKRSLLQREAV